MGLIDQRYILGISAALQNCQVIKTANLHEVATLVEQKLRNDLEKVAMGEGIPSMEGGQPGMDPMSGGQPPMDGGQPPQQAQASPEELGQVAQSGLSESDIQAAAKVVQVIAEMKQQSDQAAMAQQPNGGMQQPPPMGAQPQQPPMPPAPQPPMAGGGMQQPPMG